MADSGPPIRLELPIAAGSDDALQDPGGPMLPDWPWVSLYSAEHHGGLRFQIPDIEMGATIVAAHLELTIDSNAEGDPDVLFFVEQSASPAAFVAVDNDITARTTTGTSVAWQTMGLPEGITTTPSLVVLVAEVVSLPAWTSGSHIVFIVNSQSSTSFEYRQFEHGTGPAAKLVIDYVNP